MKTKYCVISFWIRILVVNSLLLCGCGILDSGSQSSSMIKLRCKKENIYKTELVDTLQNKCFLIKDSNAISMKQAKPLMLIPGLFAINYLIKPLIISVTTQKFNLKSTSKKNIKPIPNIAAKGLLAKEKKQQAQVSETFDEPDLISALIPLAAFIIMLIICAIIGI